MVTGDIDFKVQCHKGQVSHIVVNPEINQFASMGSEPSIRIWKVVVSQPDDLFVPIFEITWKFPVRHVALVRETICFALSHHDSPTHKVVCFNMLETGRIMGCNRKKSFPFSRIFFFFFFFPLFHNFR